MHRNSLLLTGLAGILVVLCTLPATAQTAELREAPQLEVQNRGNTLVEILPLATYEKAIEGEQWLRLKYRVRNLTSEPIRFLEVEAKVYDSEGRLTGFYGYHLGSELAPGENRLFVHRTSGYTLSPGDRVVVAPVQVETAKQSWAVDPVEEDGELLPASLFERTEGGVNLCDTRCENAESRCDSRCNGSGSFEFSCSCTEGGTLTYTCKCSRGKPTV